MNKKQFLKSFWEELMSHANIDCIPNKPGEEWIIGFELHICYGQTAKMLKRQIEKYEWERAQKWLEEMNNDDSTNGN